MADTEEFVIRPLPDGVSCRVRPHHWDGNTVHCDADQTQLFPPGTLVEISSSATIYLGEILCVQDLRLVVSVEHSLDRSVVSRIQSNWTSGTSRPEDLDTKIMP